MMSLLMETIHTLRTFLHSQKIIPRYGEEQLPVVREGITVKNDSW